MPNERIILSTSRLMLRPAYRNDTAALHASFSDPEVMRYWYKLNPKLARSTLPHDTLEKTQSWVDDMVTSSANGVTDFVICRVPTPQAQTKQDPTQPASPVIGKIGVYSASKPEIGFLIERKYWRQGLASEALLHILPYLFYKRGFEELTADIDPRNEASRAVLLRLGFEIVGERKKTFKIGDEWVDSVDLRLTKAAFMKRQNGM